MQKRFIVFKDIYIDADMIVGLIRKESHASQYESTYLLLKGGGRERVRMPASEIMELLGATSIKAEELKPKEPALELEENQEEGQEEGLSPQPKGPTARRRAAQ